MRNTYDIVIATRNRADALKLSIPLLLRQSRKPENVIVVDSSDDPAQIKDIVTGLAKTSDIPLKLIVTSPGTSRQRNIGLKEVSADVVFFPDDDSLVLPGALDAMMAIYDRDEDRVVGGVCSAEALTAPANILETAQSSYRMTLVEQIKQKFSKSLYAFERRFFPDPFLTHGRSRWSVRPIPPWLAEENAVLVEYMTGFRMSFRTEIIRKAGFHEALGRYALCEDIDASFMVLRTHLLIGARNAQIFHYKAPNARTSGRKLGVMHILNRVYVLARHADMTPHSIRQLRWFLRYKIVRYSLQMYTKFGRDRLAGAISAYRHCKPLLSSETGNSLERYLKARERCKVN